MAVEGIEVAGGGKVALPFVVGVPAVCQVCLDGEPAFRAGDGPEIGQFKPHLRQGSCIDAKGHAARRELLVLQLRCSFLLPQREAQHFPLCVGVCLLQDEFALIAVACRELCAVADAPHPQGIGLHVAPDVCPCQDGVVLEGTQSVPVVREPEGSFVAFAEGAADACAILHVFCQTLHLSVGSMRLEHQANEGNYGGTRLHSSLFALISFSSRLLKRLLAPSYIQPHLLKYFTTLTMCARESCHL